MGGVRWPNLEYPSAAEDKDPETRFAKTEVEPLVIVLKSCRMMYISDHCLLL